MYVEPRYGKPSDQITVSRKIFTKEYGNFRDSEGGLAEWREENITAVMVSSRECELTDEVGNVHGLSLTDAGSNEGSLIFHSMVVDGSAVECPFNVTNGFAGRLSGLFVLPTLEISHTPLRSRPSPPTQPISTLINTIVYKNKKTTSCVGSTTATTLLATSDLFHVHDVHDVKCSRGN